jgi:hypothetical protein
MAGLSVGGEYDPNKKIHYLTILTADHAKGNPGISGSVLYPGSDNSGMYL